MRWLVALTVLVFASSACGDDGPTSSPAPLSSSAPVTASPFAYGDDPLQFGALTVPDGPGPHPVVVFIHGGFWRNSFDLTLADPQARDAVAHGFAAWNIEYRRVGDPGGGYPGTLEDVAAAVDHLATLVEQYPLDLDRVTVVGHSAGGHLALWTGQRARLSAGAPGSGPAFVPALVVGQAPVADLSRNLDLGAGAVEAFMGAGPDEDPDSYAVADPARLLPIDVPQLIVQGGADTIVPPDRAEAYAALVDDPAALEFMVFGGADHFDVIDPDHQSWTAVLDRISGR